MRLLNQYFFSYQIFVQHLRKMAAVSLLDQRILNRQLKVPDLFQRRAVYFKNLFCSFVGGWWNCRGSDPIEPPKICGSFFFNRPFRNGGFLWLSIAYHVSIRHCFIPLPLFLFAQSIIPNFDAFFSVWTKVSGKLY